MPVSVADVGHAAQLLDGVIETTPLAHSRALSRMLGSEVYLKCENLQRMGAFKFRGACNAVFALDAATAARGVAGTADVQEVVQAAASASGASASSATGSSLTATSIRSGSRR